MYALYYYIILYYALYTVNSLSFSAFLLLFMLITFTLTYVNDNSCRVLVIITIKYNSYNYIKHN